jgi:hypothetical protein
MLRIIGSVASSVRNAFKDTFNRSNTSGGLGKADDGSYWTALRGIFVVSGNKAATSDAANTYPIASITMPDSPLDQDVSISLKGTERGTGAALWITDSGNWWAVTSGRDAGENCNCDTCTTCNAGNCDSGNCSTNGNCIAGNCNVNGPCTLNAYVPGNANYNVVPGNANYNVSPGTANPASGGNCSNWNPCNVTGNRFCRAWSAVCAELGEPVCIAWNRVYRSSPPRNIIASPCRSNTRPCARYASTANAPCNAYNAGNCNSGSPCQGWNFYTPSTTNPTNYPFAGTNPTNYPFAGTNPVTGGNCTGVYNCVGTFCSGAYNCLGYTCTAYTCTTTSFFNCNCQTCYPTYVRIIKSVANTVTQVTKWVVSSLGTSIVNSLKITTSGSQVTIEPYANNDLTGKIGSDLVYTPTGVALSSSYGIIVEPSPTDQGSQIDEITIEKI